ncbi:MAG TPA: MerR family transcriptional regulator [Candidatus Limnocylindrales bacterium]|nr:MerR family transcriptional regulator [Candidatus Limnocylindrales bacterium]
MTDETPLRRIQDVADEVGLTTRAIRYYEEMGLLTPAARSGGSHRLYDETDIERLRAIRGLRDDAGFSVGDITRLLEDTDHLARSRAAFHDTESPVERLRIARDGLQRVDRQLELLEDKIERLRTMRAETIGRRERIAAKIQQLESEHLGAVPA